MSSLRQSLVAEALALYETNPYIRERFGLTGLAGIRKSSTARLTSVLARAHALPATIEDDGFTFTSETPVVSVVDFTSDCIKEPTLRFATELNVRITSATKPAVVHLTSGRAQDWMPRTHVEWVIRQTRSRDLHGSANVHNANEVIETIQEVIDLFSQYGYVEEITITLRARTAPVEVIPLPLLERHPKRNCVVNNLIEATPKASRKEMEVVLSAILPELFKPSSACKEQINQLAKLSGYQLEFYTPLARFIDVAPWETFNETAKHRRVVRMYVDGNHASLDIGKSWASVEYATRAEFDAFLNSKTARMRTFKGHEVYQVRTVPGEGTVKAIIIAKKGQLVVVKHEDVRPSLYTQEVADDDVSYAHLLTRDDILCELFRRRFPALPSGSHISEVCKRAEKFPRNTLLKQHTGELTTIDHNRSFMSYESHPQYIGFPHTRFICAAGKCSKQGDLSPAFYVLSSIEWTDLDAQHVFESTVKDSNPECLTAVMYNFLQRYARMEVAYTVLASFVKESVLEFASRVQLTAQEHKLLSCKLIGSLIRGGLSESRHAYVSTHEDTRKQMEKELYLAQQQGVVTEFHDEEAGFGFTIPNKSLETRYHVHSFVLDYSTTETMGHFIETYKRARDSVVSICADAIRIESHAFEQVQDLFDFGAKPGQWKSEVGELADCYKHFTVKERPVSLFSYASSEALPEFVFRELPYATSRVFVSGPGGVGKTHHIVTQSSTDLIMLFPTRELRDHFKSACNAEARTLAWYLKRSSLGCMPPQGVVVLDEAFMFSREQIAELLKYTQGKVVYMMGDPCQIHNSFGTPFTVDQLSSAWERVDFKRGEVSRHGKRFGAILDDLRELTDAEILEELEAMLEEFDGVYEPTDIALVATHAEAHAVTKRFISGRPYECPIKRVKAHRTLPKYATTGDFYDLTTPREDDCGRTQSLGELSELTWFDRLAMAAETPDSYLYEPCFARTVHSQQGRTISDTRVLVSPSLVKIPGALYTAVSRVRDMSQLRLGTVLSEEAYARLHETEEEVASVLYGGYGDDE